MTTERTDSESLIQGYRLWKHIKADCKYIRCNIQSQHTSKIALKNDPMQSCGEDDTVLVVAKPLPPLSKEQNKQKTSEYLH